MPGAYGTRRLRLTPRDPHWIYARWDFTPTQLRQLAGSAADGGLFLRLRKETSGGPLVSETRLTPGATRWLVHAPEPAMRYAAELGVYTAPARWTRLARSEPVRTPPSGASSDRGFETATLTPGGQLQRHGTLTRLAPPSIELPAAFLPAPGSSINLGRGQFGAAGGPSSLDIAESSWGAPVGGVSSSWPGPPERRFRLKVNAELIVYGSTEPDAVLRVADKSVELEADGTFRLRFALPEGLHALPLTAVAADGREVRKVRLRFGRRTTTEGAVGEAPVDPALGPPGAENL